MLEGTQPESRGMWGWEGVEWEISGRCLLAMTYNDVKWVILGMGCDLI